MSLGLKTGVETLPTGASNPKGIMQGNWTQIEKLFDPDHDSHTNTGKNYDVANAIRNRVFGDAWKDISGSSPITIDFDAEAAKYAQLPSARTFQFSNAGHGKFVFLYLDTSGGQQTVTWPAGTIIVWTTGATHQIFADEPAYVEIDTITSNGTEWTVTTVTNHNLVVTDLVRLRPLPPPDFDATSGEPGDAGPTDFNGLHEVSVVDSVTVFRIANTETPTAFDATVDWPSFSNFAYLNKVTIDAAGTAPTAPTTIGPAEYAITSIVPDGTHWLFQTSTPHGMKLGDTIKTRGCTVTGYNIAETITEIVNTTEFKCANVTSPASATDGTVYRTPSPFTLVKLWTLGGTASPTLVLAEVRQEDR